MPDAQRRSARSGGFTLLELLVSTTIAALLLGLAGPHFDSLLQRWRARLAQEALHATLLLARAEAVRFGGVTLRKTAPVAGCAGHAVAGRWECGWELQRSDNSATLQHTGAFTGVRIQRLPAHNSMAFDQWGMVTGLGAYSFRIWPEADAQRNDLRRATMLCISSGGRIRTLHQTGACA